MAGRSTAAARTRWLLAGLLLASSALKLGFLLPNADMTPRADELQYLFFARSIAEGEGLPGSLRPPVHPYLLGLALAVTPAGASPRIASGLLLILVSCVTMLLLYRLAADLFDRRAGLLAAGIAGFYPDFIAGTHLLWSEGVALCPTAAALLALVRARRGASARLALLAGALLGVAALTREFVLWFAPLAALWIARSGGWSRPRARLALLVLAGTVLCVLPWTVRNAFLHRAFVPISTNTATPLFLDNNDVLPHTSPDYLVRFYAEWGEREVERERYALRHALDFIRKRPIRWAWLRLRIGVPALLRIDSLSLRHLQHGWYGEVSPGVRRGVVLATAGSYLALLVTGAFGLFAFRSSADRWLLILFLAYGALVVMPYPIEARYRSPLELVVIPFAAAWLAGAEGTVRLRKHPLRLALACAAALLALAMAWTLPPAT